ncbi:MAG: holo-ACP synthase [Planctomycetes bacterium]|nr:holo-ACP synthase [Planctomycetota bacterium]
MIVGIGVDSVAIERLATAWRRTGERFARRILTDDEFAYCRSRHRPAESLAARFCAKEAVMKCLGTGWTDGITFRQIEVRRDARGAVRLELHGAAALRAAELGIRRLHVSLTHTKDTATAFVVAEN